MFFKSGLCRCSKAALIGIIFGDFVPFVIMYKLVVVIGLRLRVL